MPAGVSGAGRTPPAAHTTTIPHHTTTTRRHTTHCHGELGSPQGRCKPSPVSDQVLILPSLLLPQEGLLQGSLMDLTRGCRQGTSFLPQSPRLHCYRKRCSHPCSCFQPPNPAPETCASSLQICQSYCLLGGRPMHNKPVESMGLLLPASQILVRTFKQ